MRTWTGITVLLLGGLVVAAAPLLPSKPPAIAASRPARETLEAGCPGLATGALTYAKLADLPEGVLIRAGGMTVTEAEVQKEIAGAFPDVRDQLRKNAFFLAERIAARRLLLGEATRASKGRPATATQSDDARITTYLRSIRAAITVTDAEIKGFYERNKDLFAGAPLTAVKPNIEAYLRAEKRQAAIDRHVLTMGQRIEILVARDWARAQLVLTRDNPIDKARWSGERPTVVAFGAPGCCGPDMTQPLMATLAETLKDEAHVVYVDAKTYGVLAARYGVESVPTFIFFDARGRLTSRRSGLLGPEEVVTLVKNGARRQGRSRG